MDITEIVNIVSYFKLFKIKLNFNNLIELILSKNPKIQYKNN